jgi:hypothetical protein
MSLWQSVLMPMVIPILRLILDRYYRNLSPSTRMLIGAGVMGYAFIGMTLSDQAEKVFGYVPSEEDKQKLEKSMPKIHSVDRESKS